MNLLQQLQGILGDVAGAAASGQNKTGNNTGIGGNLSGLLGPALLGGLAGALFTSKAARGIAGGALLAGTGAALWNKLRDRMQENNPEGTPYARDAGSPAVTQAAPQPAAPTARSTPQERAERLVRALVFAAKSDGHIDDKEQAGIYDNLTKLDIGTDAQALVQKALSEPLDPALIADGVKNADEALEIYTLSCAVVDVDHFMERSYLDALAVALKIPDDVKNELEKNVLA